MTGVPALADSTGLRAAIGTDQRMGHLGLSRQWWFAV